ncbi:MAG: TrkA family potassium uptake protein [Mobiluncus porci]|uniref:TrkA family potassium uptake protein n=1 Tax=Mobiluncus porci TaxID=2652278 RepID=A0A7K0K1W9_9ACTO|nr:MULTISPECIES: TrkA family potassium uptake protein [Mobiluncus]MCI6584448.1 TrkA family potassium uptake protein [Mobiluncus sp.]MDD7542449.1 TrkA family potassium uptake protein [Mobiluncus porci]MDY5747757.1 TrkA family potassium uptake protein [Mobiluncus porci]MST49473.1 TrkA family potassium uptake protein [Mobiluncus porci]
MNKSVAVIGLGRFGLAMAQELEASGVDVLAIDKNPEVIASAAETLRHAVKADGTDAEVLKQLAVDQFTTAVVAIGGDLAASILAASALITLNGSKIWAKASSPQQGEIFKQMGIDRIFYPESDGGRRGAHLVAQSCEDYVDLGHGFALVITNPADKYCHDTLGDLDVRRREGFSIVAIRSDSGEWETAHAGTVLKPQDSIMVVAPTKVIAKVARR